MNRFFFAALVAGFLMGPSPTAAQTPGDSDAQAEQPEPLPELSLYHLDYVWTNQAGTELQLSELRGHPVVVLFYYGSCQHVCPILVHDVQGIDGGLSEETRADTRYVMVTIDPDRDTPEARSAMADEKGLEAERFALVSGSDMGTRALAALLNVQYRRNQNGHYSHSNVITLLDRDGVPVDAIEGPRQPNESFVASIEGL